MYLCITNIFAVSPRSHISAQTRCLTADTPALRIALHRCANPFCIFSPELNVFSGIQISTNFSWEWGWVLKNCFDIQNKFEAVIGWRRRDLLLWKRSAADKKATLGSESQLEEKKRSHSELGYKQLWLVVFKWLECNSGHNYTRQCSWGNPD